MKWSYLVCLAVVVSGATFSTAQTHVETQVPRVPKVGAAVPEPEEVLVLPPLVAREAISTDSVDLPALQAKDKQVPPSPAGAGQPAPASMNVATAAQTSSVAQASTNRIWLTSEYLLWWTRGSGLPPLVTTGPASAAAPGALGQPGTSVLFGGDVDGQTRSGGRFSGGLWLGPNQTIGVEGGYFFLGQRGFSFANAADGAHVLANPFTDATTGGQSSLVLAGPAVTSVTAGRLPLPGLNIIFPTTTTTTATATANLAASFTSRLQGADTNLIWNLTPPASGSGLQFLLLGGFRHLDLHEQLDLSSTAVQRGSALTVEDSGKGGGPIPAVEGSFVGTLIRNDHFDTRNQFNGGQVGSQAKFLFGRLSLDVTGKLALGGTREEITIAGTHAQSFSGITLLAPGGPNIPPFVFHFQQQLPGGVFAQPSNIGHYSRNVFAVVPEAGLNISYQVTAWLRASVGYNFLYWSNVARVGSSIDRTVNPAFLTAPASLLALPPSGAGQTLVAPPRPAFTSRDTDFWAQGLGFTLQFMY